MLGAKLSPLVSKVAPPALARSVTSLTSQMPPCEFQPEPYKGPSTAELQKLRQKHVSPGYLTYYQKPFVAHQGHMQWLFDNEGRRYLDLFGGICTVGVGHCHPKVMAALTDQMSRLWHTTNIYYHTPIHDYCQKLASKLPDPLNVVYVTNSGSEANDLAMLMARLHTGCQDIITLRGCYHGMSAGTMGLSAMTSFSYNIPPHGPIHKIRNPDVYRGPWGGKACLDAPIQSSRDCDCAQGQCKAKDEYVAEVKDALTFCTPKGKVAGMFAETIQGNGGAVVFPKGWLKEAFGAVRAQGGLCISDEVQAGFGRTGDTYWGFEKEGVTPDIVTMAKSIGNGFPMAAVVTTAEIANTMTQALHFNTYGGNPMACAVGSAVLDVIDEENLQQNSREVGNHIFKGLAELQKELPDVIGNVRGRGLMIGIELVKNGATKEAMSPAEAGDVMEEMRVEGGVLIGRGGTMSNTLRLKPPMCITKEDADYFIKALRHVLKKHA